MLEVKNLTKSFDGLMALKDVSFTVGQGEIVGLIGPNGAGKTTAMNLISGAFNPTSGQVLLDGEDITGLPSNKICHRGISRHLSDTPTFFGHDRP